MSDIDFSGVSDADLAIARRDITQQIETLTASIADKVAARAARVVAIDKEMLARMNRNGVNSISTQGVGNFHIRVNEFYSVEDYPTFYQWIAGRIMAKEPHSNVFSIFQKKLSKTSIEAYRDDHEKALPPAIKMDSERVIVFKTLK